MFFRLAPRARVQGRQPLQPSTTNGTTKQAYRQPPSVLELGGSSVNKAPVTQTGDADTGQRGGTVGTSDLFAS
jgi:hypothetical protein